MQLLPDAERDGTCLRQGDILSGVHLVGAINLKNVSEAVVGGKAVSWTVHDSPRRGPVAVLSHCCEIDPNNGVKLTALALAPVRDASGATSQAKLAELVDSNLIQDGVTATYLKYFFLPPDPRLGGSAVGYVIDFSKAFSLHKSTLPDLLGSKVAQMSDDLRSAMSFKLALYFHRHMGAKAA